MQEGVYLAPLQGEAFMARSSFWQDWSVQVPMDCPDKACADWLGWTGDLSWAKPGCPPPNLTPQEGKGLSLACPCTATRFGGQLGRPRFPACDERWCRKWSSWGWGQPGVVQAVAVLSGRIWVITGGGSRAKGTVKTEVTEGHGRESFISPP